MNLEAGHANHITLITGATGAIGRAIARQIAAQPGYEVVLACRNEEKARQAIREIIQATGNDRVRYEVVDVSRQASIQALAKRWQGPLHVLGYFWMIQAFSEQLKQSTPARVVNVASNYAGDLDLSDLEFKRRRYSNNTAYRQSKQANRMLTVAQAEWLKSYDVMVNACHPGGVNSALSNSLGFGGYESPDEGARTPVWLATDPIGQQQTGKYFADLREVRCRFGEDKAGVEALYQACLRYSNER